jgi:hypothetical protein
MKKNNFFNHVSKWIASYDNIEALEWLRKFIDQSSQPENIKINLRIKLQKRIHSIIQSPKFTKINGDVYLMDEYGLPGIFDKKYTAVKKIVELKQLGFTATIMQDSNYYRIRLTHSAPVNTMCA